MERDCNLCGISFTAKSAKKKHCSDSCRDRDRYRSDPSYRTKKKVRASSYFHANRDRMRTVQKAYYESHWFAFQERNAARRNRILPADLVREVMESDDFTCQYCDTRGGKLTIDHKDPVSRGGSDDRENLCTACHQCNCRKGAKTVEEFLVYLEEVKI